MGRISETLRYMPNKSTAIMVLYLESYQERLYGYNVVYLLPTISDVGSCLISCNAGVTSTDLQRFFRIGILQRRC